MKIRTGANQRINEGEKRKKKKKKKKKPQPASQSSEMGNESKHGKFVQGRKLVTLSKGGKALKLFQAF